VTTYEQEPVAPSQKSRLQAAYARRMRLYWWCGGIWGVGTLLIVGSWFDLVSYEIGLVGYVVATLGAMCAWGLKSLPYRRGSRSREKPAGGK